MRFLEGDVSTEKSGSKFLCLVLRIGGKERGLERMVCSFGFAALLKFFSRSAGARVVASHLMHVSLRKNA